MKALLIGVGAAGNKSVLTVVKEQKAKLEDVILINSTSKDIPKDYKGKKIILSPNDSGCGKERSLSKDYTFTAINSGKLNLEKEVQQYDIVVIVTSLEGGTGSGAAPVIAKYCNEMLAKNTHLIGFTGFEEDVRGLQNTIEFFQEIDSEIVVQTIQNKLFLKAAGNNKFKAELLANQELAKRIEIINGSLLKDSEQNIDDTDIYKVINTKGYMTAEIIEIRESLMDTSDFDKLCKKMIYDSKSLKSNDAGQIRMGVIMNLSPASEDAIDSMYTVLKEAYGDPFECFTHKQFDKTLPEFVSFISSGMKLPIDEVEAVYKRYKEESAKVNKSADDFFTKIGGLKGNSEDSRFNMGRPSSSQKPKSKEEFMSQFQTKPSKKG